MEFNKQVNKPLATFATTISAVTALHFCKVRPDDPPGLRWLLLTCVIGSPYLTGVPPIRPLRPAHPDPAGRTYGALAAAPLLATVRDPLRRGSLLP